MSNLEPKSPRQTQTANLRMTYLGNNSAQRQICELSQLIFVLLLAGNLVAQDSFDKTPIDPANSATSSAEPSTGQPQSAKPEIAKPELEEVADKQLESELKVGGDGDAVLTKSYQRALIIDFDGPIFGSRHAYLSNRLRRARQTGVDLVIIRLTSPGGLLEESLDLSRQLSQVDWATTVAYIPKEAISGGAIIALGCDRIYMNPRALIGDAGPIVLGPNGMFEHAEEKTVSYASRAIRGVAEAKNRPGAIAEAMVDRKLKVIRATEKQSGNVEYFTAQELDDPTVTERFDVGAAIPEAGENRFLTVAGSRAVELQLAEGVFDSEADLLAALTIERQSQTRMNWIDSTVYLLNRPWLTGLVLFVALVALYIELAAPGISVAGLTSLACFGLFFWSHAIGGTSGWLEVLIFTLGVICFIVELFVVPGSGIFGLSGILLVLLALIMATQDFFLPDTKVQWEQFQMNTLIIFGSVTVVGILFVAQLLLLDSLPGMKRFQLRAPETYGAATVTTELLAKSATDVDLPQVGEQGLAESVLRPSGKVLFGRQLIDVVTEGDYLDPGTSVEVIRREGNRIVVRKI